MDFLDRLVLWVHFVYIRRIGFCHRLIFSFFLFLTKTQKQHWSSTTAEMTSYRNEETQYTVKHDERWLKTFSTDCTLRFPWVWTDSNSPYRIRNRKRRKKFRKRYIICCHRFWNVVCHCSLIIAMLMRPYSSFLANLKRISNRFLLLLKKPKLFYREIEQNSRSISRFSPLSMSCMEIDGAAFFATSAILCSRCCCRVCIIYTYWRENVELCQFCK